MPQLYMSLMDLLYCVLSVTAWPRYRHGIDSGSGQCRYWCRSNSANSCRWSKGKKFDVHQKVKVVHVDDSKYLSYAALSCLADKVFLHFYWKVLRFYFFDLICWWLVFVWRLSNLCGKRDPPKLKFGGCWSGTNYRVFSHGPIPWRPQTMTMTATNHDHDGHKLWPWRPQTMTMMATNHDHDGHKPWPWWPQTVTMMATNHDHDGHKPWPWWPQQRKHEKLTSNIQLSSFNIVG